MYNGTQGSIYVFRKGEMHISLPLFLPYLHNKELTDIRYTAITQ